MLRWRKSWIDENLEGSIRKDLKPDERSVWADLLDLCGKSRRWGYIERSEGIPYSQQELADRFVVPVRLIRSTIKKCMDEGRLLLDPSGALIVAHWDLYQVNKPDETPRPKQVPMRPEDQQASQQAAAARLGYLQPGAAKRGVDIRETEEKHKNPDNTTDSSNPGGNGKSNTMPCVCPDCGVKHDLDILSVPKNAEVRGDFAVVRCGQCDKVKA